MKPVKKILFPLFSLFLAYRTTELLGQVIASSPDDYSQSQQLIIALLLVLFITGIFAFPGFAYPTHKVLPDSYYNISKPDRLKQIYRLLGVNYFRVFLLVFFWGRKKNRQKYFNGARSGLQNFVYQTKQSEIGHLTAFIAVFMASLLVLNPEHLVLFAGLSLLNILGNLYPVVLQRYHRLRIETVIRS